MLPGMERCATVRLVLVSPGDDFSRLLKRYRAFVAAMDEQRRGEDGDAARAETELRTLLGAGDLGVEAEPVQRLWGQFLAAQGDLIEAERVLRESLARVEQKGERYEAGCTALALARVLALAVIPMVALASRYGFGPSPQGILVYAGMAFFLPAAVLILLTVAVSFVLVKKKREKVAARHKAEGEREAARIRSETDLRAAKLRAEGNELDRWQTGSLGHACRSAKEALLEAELSDGFHFAIIGPAGEHLVRYAPGSMKIQPALATHWEKQADGRTCVVRSTARARGQHSHQISSVKIQRTSSPDGATMATPW